MKLMSRTRTRARAAPAGLRLERSSRARFFPRLPPLYSKSLPQDTVGRPRASSPAVARSTPRAAAAWGQFRSSRPRRCACQARPRSTSGTQNAARPRPQMQISRHQGPGLAAGVAHPGGVQGRQKPLRVAEGIAPQGQEAKPRQAQQQQGGHLLAQAVLPGGQHRGRRRAAAAGLGFRGLLFFGALFLAICFLGAFLVSW